jgi:hypothetical protein
MTVFLFLLALPVIVGLLVACLALPLRFLRLGGSNQTMRRLGMFSCALLAFLAFFSLTAYIVADLDWGTGMENTRTHIWVNDEIVGDRFDEMLRDNRGGVTAELWVRYMVPPVVRQSCYTQDEIVCTYADALMEPSGEWFASDPLFLVQGLLSALVSGLAVSLFTRPKSI